jgi:acyl carrier protein
MDDCALILEICGLILQTLNIAVPSPQTDLLITGLIDSLALASLIIALEDHFHCTMPLDDFDLEDFKTVERIARLLTATAAPNRSSAI